MANKRTKSLMPIDTGEWLDSPRINTLSYDVRGIWLTLLCYMWESPTRGIMAHPNGKPYTTAQILRELNIDPIAIEILKESGLLAIDTDGAYYSPDMVHKEWISNIRRSAGRKGGEMAKGKVQTVTPEKLPEPEPEKITESPKVSKPVQVEKPQQAQLFNDEDIAASPPELTPAQKAKAEKKKKYKYAEYVNLTSEEYAKLCERFSEPVVRRLIEILDNYKGQNGRRYISDYRAILNWVVSRYYEEQQRYGNKFPTNSALPFTEGSFGFIAPDGAGKVPADTGASPQSGNAPEKGYAERF